MSNTYPLARARGNYEAQLGNKDGLAVRKGSMKNVEEMKNKAKVEAVVMADRILVRAKRVLSNLHTRVDSVHTKVRSIPLPVEAKRSPPPLVAGE